MRINEPTPANTIPFGYTTTISKLWKDGELPTVTKGFYGGILEANSKSPNFCTNEHIRCHCKGGHTSLSNIVLATYKNNNKRGCGLLSSFFNKKAFDQYCEQFKGLEIPYFKDGIMKIFIGDNYVKSITQTVTEVLQKEGKLNLLG